MKPVRNLMPKAIESADVLSGARAQQTLKRWDEVVGADMATRSWPDRWDRGTVWVACTGSAWAQELRMMKGELLDRLKQMSGEEALFLDLRFGVRKVSRPVKVLTEEIEPKTDEKVEVEAPKSTNPPESIGELARRRLAKWKNET